MRRGLIGLTLAAACGGGAGDTAGDAPMITGTIQPEGEDVSGEFEGYRAFAYDQGGAFIAYISSNPRATCDKVTDYLTVGAEPYDPVDVLVAGKCDFFIYLSSGYDGGLSHSADKDDEELDTVGPGVSLGCAMGEGEWVYERRDGDDKDYYWSGRWWQGAPVTYSFDFSGGDGSEVVMDIAMQEYTGAFIYEEFANDPASGDVEGHVTAEWCTGLAGTGLFGG